MTILQDQFEQMIETVDGFFGRDKILAQSRRDFLAYRDGSLAAVPTMEAELIETHPYLLGAAFLGTVQFVEGKAYAAFGKEPTPATLDALIAAGGINMRSSARAGFDFLRSKHPRAAATALALCAMASGHKVAKDALPDFKPVVPPHPPAA